MALWFCHGSPPVTSLFNRSNWSYWPPQKQLVGSTSAGGLRETCGTKSLEEISPHTQGWPWQGWTPPQMMGTNFSQSDKDERPVRQCDMSQGSFYSELPCCKVLWTLTVINTSFCRSCWVVALEWDYSIQKLNSNHPQSQNQKKTNQRFTAPFCWGLLLRKGPMLCIYVVPPGRGLTVFIFSIKCAGVPSTGSHDVHTSFKTVHLQYPEKTIRFAPPLFKTGAKHLF